MDNKFSIYISADKITREQIELIEEACGIYQKYYGVKPEPVYINAAKNDISAEFIIIFTDGRNSQTVLPADYDGPVIAIRTEDYEGKRENNMLLIGPDPVMFAAAVKMLSEHKEFLQGLTGKGNRQRVFQVVPTLNFGDAVGNDCMAIDRVLRENGYDTDIYANVVAKKLEGRARLFKDLPELTERDIVIFHFAGGSALADWFAACKCKRVIRYHNVTPPKFFKDYDKNSMLMCLEGERQIKALYNSVDYCINDSDYNGKKLREFGYTCPSVTVPIVIPFDDYKQPVDEKIYGRYMDGKFNIMFLGRVVPNKKFEDLIETFAVYKKKWNSNSRLILVGNYKEEDAYFQFLKKRIEELGVQDVVFTGHISFAGILACYRASNLFLCLSEHEGFCVPLIEAMIFKKPVIAYGACAVPETMGEGTMVTYDKTPEKVADMINYVQGHPVYLDNLIKVQNERLKYFEYETVSKRFLEAIGKISG